MSEKPQLPKWAPIFDLLLGHVLFLMLGLGWRQEIASKLQTVGGVVDLIALYALFLTVMIGFLYFRYGQNR